MGAEETEQRPELVLQEGDRQVFRADLPIPLVSRVVATTDARLLAAYGQNEVAVPVWDAQTGRERIILRGYKSPVRALAFRPNGRELVAGYQDGRVVVWDLSE